MKTLKEEAEHYSECHQDVSKELGKYLVSAVFQDGANSKWVQAELIKAQIENAYWDGGQDIPLTEEKCNQYYNKTFKSE